MPMLSTLEAKKSEFFPSLSSLLSTITFVKNSNVSTTNSTNLSNLRRSGTDKENPLIYLAHKTPVCPLSSAKDVPRAGDSPKGSHSTVLGGDSPPSKNLLHVPCKFFRQGACQAGSSCPFSHNLDGSLAADKLPCKYFQKGNCKFGLKCALAHFLPDGTRINLRVYRSHNNHNKEGNSGNNGGNNGTNGNGNSSGNVNNINGNGTCNGSFNGNNGVNGINGYNSITNTNSMNMSSDYFNHSYVNQSNSYNSQNNSFNGYNDYNQSNPLATLSYLSSTPNFSTSSFNTPNFNTPKSTFFALGHSNSQNGLLSGPSFNSSSPWNSNTNSGGFSNLGKNTATATTGAPATSPPLDLNIGSSNFGYMATRYSPFLLLRLSLPPGLAPVLSFLKIPTLALLALLMGYYLAEKTDDSIVDQNNQCFDEEGDLEDYVPASLGDILLTPQQVRRRDLRLQLGTLLVRPALGHDEKHEDVFLMD